MDYTKRKGIFQALTACIMILYIMNLFNLPNYFLYVYTSTSILIVIASTLMFFGENILQKVSSIIAILLPLGILQYTMIKYENQIKTKAIHIPSFHSNTKIVTILLGFQSYLFYNLYIHPTNIKMYGNIIVGLLSLLFSGLIWKDVSFFLTDG